MSVDPVEMSPAKMVPEKMVPPEITTVTTGPMVPMVPSIPMVPMVSFKACIGPQTLSSLKESLWKAYKTWVLVRLDSLNYSTHLGCSDMLDNKRSE